jgi:hypothetical protein
LASNASFSKEFILEELASLTLLHLNFYSSWEGGERKRERRAEQRREEKKKRVYKYMVDSEQILRICKFRHLSEGKCHPSTLPLSHALLPWFLQQHDLDCFNELTQDPLKTNIIIAEIVISS